MNCMSYHSFILKPGFCLKHGIEDATEYHRYQHRTTEKMAAMLQKAPILHLHS